MNDSGGKRRKRSRGAGWQRTFRRVVLGAQNALEIARMGRLTEPYRAPFDVRHQDRSYRLRRYKGQRLQQAADRPILLVPPLMVTSEIYDIAEDISAVGALLRSGIDVWLCDFGKPEQIEGGMDRTLDDHVGAVIDAVRRVRALTGEDVHLAGYSQGGMFCYQAAAYLRSEGLASVITFGSPVDIHRNVPGVVDGVAAQMVEGLRKVLDRPLAELEGLPGFLTSTGFKLMSVRKEAGQLVDFLTKLHDRQALEKRESRRRFLAGEGFVAWPGPALRTFIDEFIVHNRMLSGGFVIEGRTVTLADIQCPVLYFVGERDDIAKPSSVRAVQRAGVDAELFEVSLQAGHFGLVVGSKALSQTWPTVIEWIRWREQHGPKPRLLRDEPLPERLEPEDVAFEDFDFDLELLADAFGGTLSQLWNRLGNVFEDAGDALQDLRYQVPRLRELEQLRPASRVSLAKTLSDRAKSHPEQTFFLHHGRAFTYAEADGRVDAIVRGLWSEGVRPGDRIALVMGQRPSYLSAVTALNRLGAVALLIRPDASVRELRRALEMGEASALITDPERAAAARTVAKMKVLVLGGGPDRALSIDGVVDMEAIDPGGVDLPADLELNAGLARDLAMVLYTPARGTEGDLRMAQVTNGRWAFSALGAAAACTLSPDDTVYAALPLHHAAGILVTVGGALVGGSRLALAENVGTGVGGFPAHLDDAMEPFWTEVRRYGATVIFYAGEMGRSLVLAPFSPRDATNPVRLFAGSGMRPRVWRELQARFDVGVLEFYASTEVNAILANASGEKVGSVGRPLPGSAEMALVRWDFGRDEPERGVEGHLVRAGLGEAGVLVARLDESMPFDDGERLLDDPFGDGARYFVSRDVLRRDADGDHVFVGRLSEVFLADGVLTSMRAIEDALDTVEGVALPVAFKGRLEGEDAHHPVAYVAMVGERALDLAAVEAALADFPRAAWPRAIRQVDLEAIPLTDGFRPIKSRLDDLPVPRPGSWILEVDGYRRAERSSPSARPSDAE